MPETQLLVDEDDPVRFFAAVSSLDCRYYPDIKYLVPFLSENARLSYQLTVEAKLIKVLYDLTVIKFPKADDIVAEACKNITGQRIYWIEDNITKHDMRAMVEAIRERIDEAIRAWIHFAATSYNIINTADSIRRRALLRDIIIPSMIELEIELIRVALREKDTLQVGRTHGQHALPQTFGFALAQFVSRLGNCIVHLKALAEDLPGSFAGAVGAYNATALFFDDPEAFEQSLLDEVDLQAAEICTQIVPPEPFVRILQEIVLAAGAIGNLADDLRNLQRTEIGEVFESFGLKQVGSSTMSHKQNPITPENAKSNFKVIKARIMTAYDDLISEHNRDLTNSLSNRQYDEIFCYFYLMVTRMTKMVRTMDIDRKRMEANLYMTGDQMASEAIQLALGFHGYADGHEKMRTLTKQIRAAGRTGERHALYEAVTNDPELTPYLAMMSEKQLAAIRDIRNYTGIAVQKTEEVCLNWADKLGIHHCFIY